MAESAGQKKPVKPLQETPVKEKKPFIPVKPFVNPSSFNKSGFGGKSGGAKPPILKHSRSR